MSTAADDLDYPLAGVLWTLVLLFALMTYFWLAITALGHLFRRAEVSGWAKTGWVAFILLVPLIGSVTYLVTQGRVPTDRDARRPAPGSGAAPGFRGVDEIARAKRLLDDGAISQEEFEQLKRRVLV